MPLAPAHPAVVLPLQRLGLPLSALLWWWFALVRDAVASGWRAVRQPQP